MIIATRGWLELADARLERGDLLVIPGGAEWRTVAASEDLAAVEVSLL